MGNSKSMDVTLKGHCSLNIRAIGWGLTYFIMTMSYFHPSSWRENKYIYLLMVMLRLISLAIVFVPYIWKKTLLTKFDLIVILICVMIVISGIYNSPLIINTLNYALRIAIEAFLIKRIAIENGDIQRNMLLGMSYCLVLFCTINSVNIIVNGKLGDGVDYFLGKDNSVANAYIIALTICYVLVLVYKKYKLLFAITLIDTLIYIFVLEIGSMKICLIASALFVLLVFITSSNCKIVYDIRLYTIISIFTTGFIIACRSVFFANIVDMVLYGKYHNLLYRAQLWKLFWDMSLLQPIWGTGFGQREGGNTIYSMFISSGNCHNTLLEILLHAGYVVFFLFLCLVFITAEKAKKLNKRNSSITVFYIIWAIHGIVEVGFVYGFTILAIIYYLPNIALEENLWYRDTINNH